MPHPTVLPDRPQIVAVPIDAFKWPSGDGRTVVVLRAEPAELAARYGIAFTRDIDDLDYNLAAVMRLPSGRHVLLIRYERNQHPGTEVLTDRADSLDAAWEELRSVLGVNDSAANWRSELRDGAGQTG